VEITKEHLNLVQRIAKHICRSLPQSVELNDLVQDGMEGLLKAAESHGNRDGATFPAYAGLRIRGQILDALRGEDNMHRNMRSEWKAIQKVEDRLHHELKRPPTPAEVAEAANTTVSRYFYLQDKAYGATLVRYDGLDSEAEGSAAAGERALASISPEAQVTLTPEIQAEMLERAAIVNEAMESLTAKERDVIELIYGPDEFTATDIAAAWSVSIGRISRLHRNALRKLRNKVADLMRELVLDD
jgi:RNA polymerase sigma factor for flagellar operon FliA